MNYPPIVKIEIESMRHSLKTMLSEHVLAVDEQMRAAVDEALKPENVAEFLREQVRIHMRAAISDEIQRAFGYTSAGRAAIREAVMLHLEEQFGEKQ